MITAVSSGLKQKNIYKKINPSTQQKMGPNGQFLEGEEPSLHFYKH